MHQQIITERKMQCVRRRTTSLGLVPAWVYARACSEVYSGRSVRQAALANNNNHVTLSRYLKRRAEEGSEVNLKRAAAIYFGLTPNEVSVLGQAHKYATHML